MHVWHASTPAAPRAWQSRALLLLCMAKLICTMAARVEVAMLQVRCREDLHEMVLEKRSVKRWSRKPKCHICMDKIPKETDFFRCPCTNMCIGCAEKREVLPKNTHLAS